MLSHAHQYSQQYFVPALCTLERERAPWLFKQFIFCCYFCAAHSNVLFPSIHSSASAAAAIRLCPCSFALCAYHTHSITPRLVVTIDTAAPSVCCLSRIWITKTNSHNNNTPVVLSDWMKQWTRENERKIKLMQSLAAILCRRSHWEHSYRTEREREREKASARETVRRAKWIENFMLVLGVMQRTSRRSSVAFVLYVSVHLFSVICTQIILYMWMSAVVCL